MAGLFVLLLAIGLPLGILAFVVLATKAEYSDHGQRVSRLISMIVFALAALVGVFWVLKVMVMNAFLLVGLPAAIISALLAALTHPWLVGKNWWQAAFTGTLIAILAAIGTLTLYGLLLAPKKVLIFVAAFGAEIIFRPEGFLALLTGALAGVLLWWLSSCQKQPMEIGTGQGSNLLD